MQMCSLTKNLTESLFLQIMRHRDKILLPVKFLDLCLEWREKLAPVIGYLKEEANDGELAAFISYAISFPDGFMALVDTYDTLRY